MAAGVVLFDANATLSQIFKDRSLVLVPKPPPMSEHPWPKNEISRRWHLQPHIVACCSTYSWPFGQNSQLVRGFKVVCSGLCAGHVYVLEDLVRAGATLDLRENEGATPLYLAAYFSQNEIVEKLLNFGEYLFWVKL